MIYAILIQSKRQNLLGKVAARCFSDWVMVLVHLRLDNRLLKLLRLRVSLKAIAITSVVIFNVYFIT